MNLTFCEVTKVDKVSLKLKTRLSKGGLSHTVLAGTSVLSLTMIHNSLPSKFGQLSAEGDVKANLKAGGIYEAYGEVYSRERVGLWLQESGSKKRISDIVSVVPKVIVPTPVTVFIP